MQRWELSAFDWKHLALVSVPRPAPGPVRHVPANGPPEVLLHPNGLNFSHFISRVATARF